MVSNIEKPFKVFFKDYLKSNAKELARFMIVATIVFLVMVTILGYLLVKILGIDTFVSGMIISIITALTIIFIDEKKFHAHQRMVENHRQMARRLLGK